MKGEGLRVEDLIVDCDGQKFEEIEEFRCIQGMEVCIQGIEVCIIEEVDGWIWPKD